MFRTTFLSACLSTALGVVAVPAASAPKANLQGEKILADFAQCAVRAAPRQSQAVLNTRPDSEDERAQLDILLQRQIKCLNFAPSILDDDLASQVNLGRISLSQAVSQMANQRQQMTFSRRAFRGAIAARLYLDAAKAKPMAAPIAAFVDDRDPTLAPGYVVVRCAVARDPATADRLVRAKRLSTDEADAGRAFAPSLNNCARGMGKIDISGTAIHGWAAEALYKLRRPDAMEGR